MTIVEYKCNIEYKNNIPRIENFLFRDVHAINKISN